MADAKKAITMDDLLKEENIKSLASGEVIEGTVLSVKKHEVLVDLGPHGVGVVPRREVGFSQKLTEGDAVTALRRICGISGSLIQTRGNHVQHFSAVTLQGGGIRNRFARLLQV